MRFLGPTKWMWLAGLLLGAILACACDDGDRTSPAGSGDVAAAPASGDGAVAPGDGAAPDEGGMGPAIPKEFGGEGVGPQGDVTDSPGRDTREQRDGASRGDSRSEEDSDLGHVDDVRTTGKNDLPSFEELDRMYSNPKVGSRQPCNCYPQGGDCDYFPHRQWGEPDRYRGFEPEKVCPEGELCTGDAVMPGICKKPCTATKTSNIPGRADDDTCPAGFRCATTVFRGWETGTTWGSMSHCQPESGKLFLRWRKLKEERERGDARERECAPCAVPGSPEQRSNEDGGRRLHTGGG